MPGISTRFRVVRAWVRIFNSYFLIFNCLLLLSSSALAAEHQGVVTTGGVPIPGATITATQSETKFVTVTERDGSYRLTDLVDGVWTITIEMLGFSTLEEEVNLPSEPRTWELQLLPFLEIASRAKSAPIISSPTRDTNGNSGAAATAAGNSNPPSGQQRGFQRAGVNTAAPVAPLPAALTDETSADAAADGLLINGSVNNSAASLFAQPRAFGNLRPGQRSLYTGMIGLQLGNSAWDARPFSFTGVESAKPSYYDAQLLGTFGGPVKLPGFSNRANLFVGYQGSSDHNAIAQSALMPTLLERSGDFSQTRDALGRPVEIVNPRTGRPFPGNVIPREQFSPQAAALLAYYPLPNSTAGGRFNYQTPTVIGTRQDNVQTRVTQAINGRNQLAANLSYQRTATDTTTLFGFQDENAVSGLDAQINWFHRIQFFSFRLRYQYTRLTTQASPYFADRTNVSGDAAISGNNQEPQNWGPPGLTFSSGMAGLADALPAFNRTQTHGGSAEAYFRRGEHNFTFGGDARRNPITILSQQDPRGTFAFTGAFTGYDFADFLLGVPRTSSIAFGNADKYFHASSYDAYVTDDWRLSPTLTLNLGVRWEYETPITESRSRLVNLDVANGFSAVSPVAAGDPRGGVTGASYPRSLVRPDRNGFQPRLAMAWRPVPGSSLVVRAGYGLYRNTNVYQSIATLLAQQPPLSYAFSVENSAVNPFTLADGFARPQQRAVLNTFAVDPDFRVSAAHNWQVSAQRDLPVSLTIVASYLGSRGINLMQEFLPNTYPAGAANPCVSCPAGFVYLTSGGTSLRNAGQIQLRRRLRNGLGASVQYTLAKATDNAAAFGGASLTGASIAQDWLDLEAERGRSSFDQRHLVTAQVQYTTGAGVTGGTLMDGTKGRLLKDWTFTTELSTGTGLPLTPVYLTQVRGTGVLGTIRAATTGAPADRVLDGYYMNPAAYAPPASGQWGNAGRNSVTGPRTFSLDASIARTFRWGDRVNLDWRIDAANVLNQVTYAGVNTLVVSPQFGLPNRANAMRKLRSSLRVRF